MKLKNTCHVAAGYQFRGRVNEVLGTGIVAVQMKNISDDKEIIWSNCIETKLLNKRPPNFLRKGDILFAARGGQNYSVLIKDLFERKNAVASPHFFVIRNEEKKVLSEYISWFLNQEPSQRYFQRESEGTLTKSIRRSVLEETPIIIPSLEKQQTIIDLSRTLKEEHNILKQLIGNGETTMNTIANDLFASDSSRGTK